MRYLSEDYEFVWDKEVDGQRLDRLKQVLIKAPALSESSTRKRRPYFSAMLL